jgi:hypothetical protein
VVEKARGRGEIPRTSDPVALAMLASAALHTLAVHARAGLSRKELDALVAATVELICGPKH